MADRALPDLKSRIYVDDTALSKTRGNLRSFGDDANTHMGRAGKSVDEFGNVVGRVGVSSRGAFATIGTALQGVALIGAGIGAVGLGIAAGLGAAVKSSIEFNSQMANVATLIPNSTARVNELKSTVQNMAIETGKSTDDLAGGLYQVISAFGDTADTAKITEINAKAAAAGLATTTDAINLTSAVTKGYGDTSAEAVQHVSDLAFETVKLGQTTFPELAASMGQAVPLAKTLGVSMEDLFASEATLTGVTGDTSQVTTGLRAAMQSLLVPSADMQAALEKIGFKSGQAAIASLGWKGTLDALSKTTGGNTTELAKMFTQVEGLNQVIALTGSQSDTFNDKQKQMSNAAGTANQAFKDQTQGVNKLGFEIQQAQQFFSVLAQKIGDSLSPGLAGLLDIFQRLEPGIQTVATDVAHGLSDAFSGLDRIVRGVTDPLSKVSSSIDGVGTAVDNNKSQIDTLGGIFSSFADTAGKADYKQVGQKIADAVLFGLHQIVNFDGQVTDDIRELSDRMDWKKIGYQVGLHAPEFAQGIGSSMGDAFWKATSDAIVHGKPVIPAPGEGIFDTIQAASAKAGADTGRAFIQGVTDWGKTHHVPAADIVRDLASGPSGAVRLADLALTGLTGAVQDWAKQHPIDLGQFLSNLFPAGGSGAGPGQGIGVNLDISSMLLPAVNSAITGAETAFTIGGATIGAIWGSTVGALLGKGQEFASNVPGIIGGGVQGVQGWFTWLGGEADRIWGGIYGTVTGWASGAASFTSQTFDNMKNGIGDAFSQVGGKIHEGLSGARGVVVNFVDKVDKIPIIGDALIKAGFTPDRVPGFAKGGIVPGLGGGDNTLARLTPGEVVLNRGAVSMLGGPSSANLLNEWGLGGVSGALGTWGGQCLWFVNQLTGLFSGIPMASMLAPFVNSATPKDGEVFVSVIPPFGHTGFVAGGGTQAYDSNWVGNEIVGVHSLAGIPDIVGYIDIGQKLGTLAGLLTGFLDVPGTVKRLAGEALGGISGWPRDVASSILGLGGDAIVKRFDSGGRWPSGMLGYNGTGQDEFVIPPGGGQPATEATQQRVAALMELMLQKMGVPLTPQMAHRAMA